MCRVRDVRFAPEGGVDSGERMRIYMGGTQHGGFWVASLAPPVYTEARQEYTEILPEVDDVHFTTTLVLVGKDMSSLVMML